MSRPRARPATANQPNPVPASDAEEILNGLLATPKRLSPKYFYDEAGSRLFDQICQLPEYYLTRTEHRIMDRHLHEMAALIGPRASVIEFGSGSSQKIRQLLDHLVDPAAYVPVDISQNYLLQMADDMAKDYPKIQIRPVTADFTRPFELPVHEVHPARNLIFFPGSTIGNFEKLDARSLLEVMRLEAKPGGALLIGVDLKKDPEILHAAYNDSRGVTAAFNLNVLRHLNRILPADFDLSKFRHEAVYDEADGRIEMRLVCTKAHWVSVAGRNIRFADGDHIVTEYSHKYSMGEFVELAQSAGFEPQQSWEDDDSLFGVHYLTVPR